MPEVTFQHENCNNGNPLVIETGMDEVYWSYNINVAKFPTYGGEVVQILSVYIGDLFAGGTLHTYKELEAVYTYFMEYFINATQGPEANVETSKYEQAPMIFQYPERQWHMEIQPLNAPDFEYGKEVVTPIWRIQAHVVDKTHDVEKLKELIAQELVNNEKFKLTGVISPLSGDPAENPFVAPNTKSTKYDAQGNPVFEPKEAAATAANLEKYADYYSSLLPAYMKGDYEDIINTVGARPAFGHSGSTNEEEKPDEKVKGSPLVPSKRAAEF